MVVKESTVNDARPESPLPPDNKSPPWLQTAANDEVNASDSKNKRTKFFLAPQNQSKAARTKQTKRAASPVPTPRRSTRSPIQTAEETDSGLGSGDDSDSSGTIASKFSELRKNLSKNPGLTVSSSEDEESEAEALSDSDDTGSDANTDSRSDNEWPRGNSSDASRSGSESESKDSVSRPRQRGTSKLLKNPSIYRMQEPWPLQNVDNHELLALLPPVHQQIEQAVTVEQQLTIMIKGSQNRQQGKGKGTTNSAFSVTDMASWVPADDRVSSITNQTLHAWTLGCMAGHFISTAQKFCLIKYVANHPTWIPKSTAGKFFLDHLLVGKEAAAMKKSPFKPTKDWLRAKNEADEVYVDNDSGYSDNEKKGQTAIEKSAHLPAQACYNELSTEERNNLVHLGFGHDPNGEMGWQTCHDQHKLPALFDGLFQDLTVKQKSALGLLGISKKMFAQLCSTGVSRKITRIWASLNSPDQAAAKLIGYNAHPHVRKTWWSSLSVKWAANDSGDIEEISDGYGGIKWHCHYWDDIPDNIRDAALQLHFDKHIWNQITTLIKSKETAASEEQSRKDKAKHAAEKAKTNAERQATSKAAKKAKDAIRQRRNSTSSSSADSPPEAPEPPKYFKPDWTELDTDFYDEVSHSENPGDPTVYSKLFGVYPHSDVFNAEALHGRDMNYADHPEGAKIYAEYDTGYRLKIRRHLRKARYSPLRPLPITHPQSAIK